MTRGRLLGWAALVVVVVGALAYGTLDDGGPRSPGDRARNLAETIACPQCDGQSVADSDSEAAKGIRLRIDERIADGASDAQIQRRAGGGLRGAGAAHAGPVGRVEPRVDAARGGRGRGLRRAGVRLPPVAGRRGGAGLRRRPGARGPGAGCARARRRARRGVLVTTTEGPAVDAGDGGDAPRAAAGSAAARRRIDPDALAALVDERDFLLRSLEDLEREHDAGDVDDHDYETLKDDYTARAARAIRAVESHQARARAGAAPAVVAADRRHRRRRPRLRGAGGGPRGPGLGAARVGRGALGRHPPVDPRRPRRGAGDGERGRLCGCARHLRRRARRRPHQRRGAHVQGLAPVPERRQRRHRVADRRRRGRSRLRTHARVPGRHPRTGRPHRRRPRRARPARRTRPAAVHPRAGGGHARPARGGRRHPPPTTAPAP